MRPLAIWRCRVQAYNTSRRRNLGRIRRGWRKRVSHRLDAHHRLVSCACPGCRLCRSSRVRVPGNVPRNHRTPDGLEFSPPSTATIGRVARCSNARVALGPRPRLGILYDNQVLDLVGLRLPGHSLRLVGSRYRSRRQFRLGTGNADSGPMPNPEGCAVASAPLVESPACSSIWGHPALVGCNGRRGLCIAVNE